MEILYICAANYTDNTNNTISRVQVCDNRSCNFPQYLSRDELLSKLTALDEQNNKLFTIYKHSPDSNNVTDLVVTSHAGKYIKSGREQNTGPYDKLGELPLLR